MLSELESWLSGLLARSLPAGTAVSAGPVGAAALGTGVNVNAGALAVWPAGPQPQEGARSREPAYQLTTVRLAGDSKTTRFPLAGDELAEVRLGADADAPVGRLARLGDQCWHENGQLSFLRPPAGPVAALLRGAQATGYRQAVPASLVLTLSFQGPRPADVDGWCATALAAVLWAFAEADYLQLAEVAALGFGWRLLHPRAELRDLARDAVGPDSARLARTRLSLEVAGELELQLALGAAEAPATIRRILGTLDTGTTDRFGVPTAPASSE